MSERGVLAQEIEQYAKDNKLFIHPGQAPLKWADLVIRKGGVCPCVPGRNHCPCEFALEDIKELGRCRCGLFCNNTYLKEYNRLNLQRKAGKDGSKGKERISEKNHHKRILHRR